MSEQKQIDEAKRTIEWLRREKQWRTGHEPTDYIDFAITAIQRNEVIRVDCEDCLERDPGVYEFERGWNSCAKSILGILDGGGGN